MTEIHRTADGTPFVRTPDERFSDLPEWPYAPHHVVVDGLRMAYVDEGPRNARVILLLHGEPTWGYLYRRMLPTLLDAGHRAVVPDLVGFGRSDKPTERATYTYGRHVSWLTAFVEALDLARRGHVHAGLGRPVGTADGRRASRPLRPPGPRQHVPPGGPTGRRRVPGLAAGQPGDEVPRRRRAAAAGHAGPHAHGRRSRRLPGAVPRRAAHGRRPAVPAAGPDRS